MTRLLGVAALVLLTASPAAAEPIACQGAVVTAAAKLAQAEMAATDRCVRARLAGKLPAASDCASDADVQAARANAEGVLRRSIAKACGGSDRVCGSGDAEEDALATFGWDIGTCPGFTSGTCANAIADCDDVAICVACVTDAAVGVAAGPYGARAEPAPSRTVAGRCQSAIAKEGAKYLRARVKAVAHCEDLVVRGTIPGPCPSGDSATITAIARAEAIKRAHVCKACGGADHECDGSNDVTPGGVDFDAACPPLSRASGPSCSAAVEDMSDVVTCSDCVSDFVSDCLDALAVPGVKSYPPGCAVQPTPTPTATATATPTATPTPTATVTPPAGPVQIKCERAIVKESGRLARTRAEALAGCAEDKQKGKLLADADCLIDSKAGATIAKGEARLLAKVAAACGGANRQCDAGDQGRDADLAPPEFGWSAGECPGFETADCAATIVDCGDVATCISCVQRAAVGQALALAFPAATFPADPDLGACQRAIGRAAVELLAARSSALQRCADATLASGTTGLCPKSAAAIQKAEDKFLGAVCRACGGSDHSCGGTDDPTPAELGFPAVCPDVVGPDGSCGGPLDTVDDLIGCWRCVSGFKSECLDQIAIPDLRGYDAACRPGPAPMPTATGPTPTAPTPSPTPGGICGNHVVEPGEDCDDGNQLSCDDCPSNCRFAPVACPTAGRQAQTVRLERVDAQPLTSALFCLEYPVGTVALPGSGLVTMRVSGFPGLTTVNDFNNAAKIGLVGTTQLTQINVTLSLDLCAGATPPLSAEFACDTISASSAGASIDPATVNCTPVTP